MTHAREQTKKIRVGLFASSPARCSRSCSSCSRACSSGRVTDALPHRVRRHGDAASRRAPTSPQRHPGRHVDDDRARRPRTSARSASRSRSTTTRRSAPTRKAILQIAGITGLKVIDLRGGALTSPRLAAGAADRRRRDHARQARDAGRGHRRRARPELMERANKIVASAPTRSSTNVRGDARDHGDRATTTRASPMPTRARLDDRPRTAPRCGDARACRRRRRRRPRMLDGQISALVVERERLHRAS